MLAVLMSLLLHMLLLGRQSSLALVQSQARRLSWPLSRLYSDECNSEANDERTIVKVPLPGEHFMRLALRHAQFALREKEVPIGAVLVDDDTGRILAASRNSVESKRDATAHAEVDVMRKASQLRDNWRLSNCTLYSTLEPCAMCLAAMQGFRVKKVVYAAKDLRLGACGSWVNLVSAGHPFHDVQVEGGLLEEESATLLKRFFQLRRREGKEKNYKANLDRASSYGDETT